MDIFFFRKLCAASLAGLLAVVGVAGCSNGSSHDLREINNAPTAVASAQPTMGIVSPTEASTAAVSADVGAIIRIVDDLKPVVAEYMIDSSPGSPGREKATEFINERLGGDNTAIKIFASIDAGFTLPPGSIEPVVGVDYKHVAYFLIPDSGVAGFKIEFINTGNGFRLGDSEWLTAGQEWLARHPEMEERWSR